MDPVVDENGRLTAETKAELERIFLERPDLLEQYVDGLATILRDAARRPSPARSAPDVSRPKRLGDVDVDDVDAALALRLASPPERRKPPGGGSRLERPGDRTP